VGPAAAGSAGALAGAGRLRRPGAHFVSVRIEGGERGTGDRVVRGRIARQAPQRLRDALSALLRRRHPQCGRAATNEARTTHASLMRTRSSTPAARACPAPPRRRSAAPPSA
jgi:hypothetical protein